MKSSEWGAAAYLSMSQYGYSKGTINTTTEKARNNLDINGTVKNPNGSDCGIFGITGYSAKERKTGNIYGVFDMSCGLAEYTAAYVNNSSGTEQGNAFATGTSTHLSTAYPNKSTTNIDFNSAYKAKEFCPIYGDAIWETTKNVGSGQAWFEDTMEDDGPATEVFFPRGGQWYSVSTTGLCDLYDNDGGANYGCGFRSVLVVE